MYQLVFLVTCVADATLEALLTLRPSLYTESSVIAAYTLDGSKQGLAVITSIVATSMIGRNIWASINHHHGASNRRHRNLLDIFIQTSAVYCLSLIASATCGIVFSALNNQHTIEIVEAVNDYAFGINLIITVQDSSTLTSKFN